MRGAEGAVDIVFRRALAEEPDRRDDLAEAYRREAMSPIASAERLAVDEVIAPSETRAAVATSLRSLRRGLHPGFRHDNLPQ